MKLLVPLQTFLTLVVSIFCLSPSMAFAADGDNMYVHLKSSSTPVRFALDNLDKITFSSTAMSVWTSQTQKSEYAYTNVKQLTFSETGPSGIELPETAAKQMGISYDRQTLLLSVWADEPIAHVAVYDLQGRIVTSQKANGLEAQLSLASIPQGVYIVRAVIGGKGVSKKIVK